jgi:small subunit ribosomal protein S6
MDKYEMVVIVDAVLSQEEKEKINKDVCDTVTKCGGEAINSQVWLDKQKFSFRMKKRTEGTYYLVNFKSPKDALAKIRQILRIHEQVLRFLIVKV